MRLIDGDAFNAYLQDEYHGAISDSELKVYKIMMLIDNAPTIDPVKRGKWERMVNAYGEIEGFMCECGCQSVSAPNFCPSCGCDMRGDS